MVPSGLGIFEVIEAEEHDLLVEGVPLFPLIIQVQLLDLINDLRFLFIEFQVLCLSAQVFAQCPQLQTQPLIGFEPPDSLQ